MSSRVLTLVGSKVTEAAARRTLILLAAAELLAMSLWFTGTAVLPQLAAEWGSSLAVSAWLTMAVQLGFVSGALGIAIFNLPDIFSAPQIFVICCVRAAVA